MRFNLLLSTVTANLLCAARCTIAQIVIRAYSSPIQCSGPSFSCSVGNNVCCTIPDGFGFSAGFENLPAGFTGEGFTDAGCTSFLFSIFGPGNRCWNGGGSRAGSLKFLPSVEAREAGDVEKRSCVLPTGFDYHDGDGVHRSIRVPGDDPSAAEVIVQLYLNRDWDALAEYETF
ncbi:hypothetical protein NMY22_g11806 [Coprinellus aureogranulatus]|nr:hypothetical protein NMY22_g11806 [Coprinellus aureogranulatus]